MIVRLVGILLRLLERPNLTESHRIPRYEPGTRKVIDGKLCIYARWDRK